MRILSIAITVLFLISISESPSVKAGEKKIDPTTSNNKKTITNSVDMELALIPLGEFTMGSPKSEKHRDDNEVQHKVHFTKPFYLATTEVTQKQWRTVMGTTPWPRKDFVKKGDDYPATYVNWNEARAFIKKLNQKEGTDSYRLPTEAEWEYASRGGSTRIYSFGDSTSQLKEYAWFDENASEIGRDYAHRVAQKRANSFGLFDMHGNVYEWCSDWYGEDYYNNSPIADPPGPSSGFNRVLRGGSWLNAPRYVRSASRSRYEPDNRFRHIGFRVAKTVTPTNPGSSDASG